jgi:Ohr subfamily peroxiredoxin
MGAIGVAAAQKKVALPEAPSIDATIDLVMEGSEFVLRAKLDVSVPGIAIELARELVDLAHDICPYSKATRGNIDVQLNVLEPALAC